MKLFATLHCSMRRLRGVYLVPNAFSVTLAFGHAACQVASGFDEGQSLRLTMMDLQGLYSTDIAFALGF